MTASKQNKSVEELQSSHTKQQLRPSKVKHFVQSLKLPVPVLVAFLCVDFNGYYKEEPWLTKEPTRLFSGRLSCSHL